MQSNIAAHNLRLSLYMHIDHMCCHVCCLCHVSCHTCFSMYYNGCCCICHANAVVRAIMYTVMCAVTSDCMWSIMCVLAKVQTCACWLHGVSGQPGAATPQHPAESCADCCPSQPPNVACGRALPWPFSAGLLPSTPQLPAPSPAHCHILLHTDHHAITLHYHCHTLLHTRCYTVLQCHTQLHDCRSARGAEFCLASCFDGIIITGLKNI